MKIKLKALKLVLVILALLTLVGCNRSNSSKVMFYRHDGAEWDETYTGISVEGVTAQSYENQDGSVYVIVRGRIVNSGPRSFTSICVWASLVSSDDRIGGESDTCSTVYHMEKGRQGNFEVRIDNPAFGKWYIDFAISGR